MSEEKKNKTSKTSDDAKEVKKTVKKTVAKKTTTKTKSTKKTTSKKTEEAVDTKALKGGSFIPSVGRRKTAIARVRLIKNGKGLVTVNGKKFDEFFTAYALRVEILAP